MLRRDRLRWGIGFSVLLLTFFLLFLLSWPVVESFDLWVLKDRSNSLNLEYLLDDKLRLGVDTFYQYGLLPVLLQHVVFAAFGRGHWPMLGFTLFYIVAAAAAWAMFPRDLPRPRLWLIAIVALAPIILFVNLKLVYCFVLIPTLFALVAVLRGRPDLALAVSTIGCLSVPSLPLVLTGMLLALTLAAWWNGDDRSVRRLVRLLAPAAGTYGTIAAVLVATYGWASFIATALPGEGAEFYKVSGFGFTTSGMIFLHPPGVGLRYYVFYRPTWWGVGTLMLFGLAAVAAARMLRRRAIDPGGSVVVICAVLQAVYVAFAFGTSEQHLVYDPLIVAGVIVGLATLVSGRVQTTLTATFLGLGVLSHAGLAHQTMKRWLTDRATPVTAGLYADPAWTVEWGCILRIADRHKLLLLSYATGVHHYFPQVGSPKVWYLQRGQLLPADKTRVMAQIEAADVLVEDLSGPTEIFTEDPDISREIAARRLVSATANFRIWRSPRDNGCPSVGSTAPLLRAGAAGPG